jgi:YesN/AraC family two-component response regulator
MPPNWGDKYSVLLIAADEASKVLCSKVFGLYSDIVFLYARDPSEGRILAGEYHVDIVITDVEFDCFNRIASEGFFRATQLICPLTQFIVCSAVREDEMIQKYLQMGVSAYLFKPIIIDELLRKVFSLIGRLIPDQLKEKY